MAPNKKQVLTTVDVQAKVGCLTVVYGNKPQIEIGPKLAEHGLTFDEIDSEEYKIAITLPTGLTIKNFSVEVGIGSVDLRNMVAGTVLLTGTGNISLDGFHSETLELNSS